MGKVFSTSPVKFSKLCLDLVLIWLYYLYYWKCLKKNNKKEAISLLMCLAVYGKYKLSLLFLLRIIYVLKFYFFFPEFKQASLWFGKGFTEEDSTSNWTIHYQCKWRLQANMEINEFSNTKLYYKKNKLHIVS